MTRVSFVTDVSRFEFEKVRFLLDSARKTTRPKIHDTYDVLCAVLYVVRNDVSWRNLPECFPPWRSVHHHFIQWTSPNGPVTTLEQALDILGLPEVGANVRALIDARKLTVSQIQGYC